MQNKIEEIWIDLNEELYNFVLSKVKDEEISKDIVQEVFIKIQTNIHKLKHASKLTSWTYQITRNAVIDHHRKMKNNTALSDSLILIEDDKQNFEYAKLSDCINGKIDNLSKEYKEAIVLTYLKNFSQKRLAEHIQLSYSGAKSRVQKARAILKKNMLDCPNIESDHSGKVIDFKKSK